MSRSHGDDTSVGILGAGLSGLAVGMALIRAGHDTFSLYEEQPDVGGTWYRNTYPGLHCDIPSHLYCYSTEPNPDWSMVFAGQREIQAYLRSCAERHGLVERTRFATRVMEARWDDADACWELLLADGSRTRHRVLVSATGGLTAPNLPKITGLDRFAGPWWHAGAWRHDVDLTAKRVAVVGSAASAVQVVPEVARVAAEVFVYSRTPNWVMPRHNRPYTDDEKAALQAADQWQRLRRRQYRDALDWYRAFKKHQTVIDSMKATGLAHLRSAIDDPALIEALTPHYDPGCKRILLSDEYYPALARDHVHLVPRGVTALTEHGVVDADGAETPVDVVVFCTGYRLGARTDGSPALEVYGRHGERLRNALAQRTEAYRGMAIPGFPNWFTVCGVNGSIAYGPLFLSAELHADWIARWVRHLDRHGLRSVEVHPEATAAWAEEVQAELSTMSWAGDCPNFYRDARGRIVAFHPGTVGRMRRELAELHLDDFLVS